MLRVLDAMLCNFYVFCNVDLFLHLLTLACEALAAWVFVQQDAQKAVLRVSRFLAL